MRNPRKTLMIAGGLLVVATSASYLMLLRADHRAIAEATAGMSETGMSATGMSATGMSDSARGPDADLRSSPDHVSQGSIDQPALPAATTKPADVAQQKPAAPVTVVVEPAQGPATPSASAPPQPAVPPSVSAQAQPAAQPSASAQPKPSVQPSISVSPQLPAQPSAPPSAAVASVDAQSPAASTANHAQRASRGRDTLERHATTNRAGTTAETAETAALVRESSRLDPSLPPPTGLPVRSSTDGHSSSAGANAVGAAMTAQLVRESSSLGPSSSPKDNSAAAK
ncbi:extensin [Burkholderia sp. MR1-5-21]